MPRNVEEQFLAAYHRLAARAPLNEKLKARVTQGKPLTINQSTLAIEAGHSRTMLSQRSPGYERICALLYPEQQNTSETTTSVSRPDRKSTETAAQRIAKLTAENLVLAHDRDRYATCTAEAYSAIRLLRNDLKKLEADLKRYATPPEFQDTEF